jgi:predicted nucleic acid-binding protein
MALYVVDASVVIGRLIHEPYTPYATALFRQSVGLHQLCIPEFCRLECVNVLWKHVRFQGMPQSTAEQVIRDLSALPLKVVAIKRLYRRALQIGLRYQLAVYDSVYVALAERLGCPLISLDSPQLHAAQMESVIIKPLTEFKS